MRENVKWRRILFSLQRYIAFFLLIAFIITCCMYLFLLILQRTLGIRYTEENIRAAAALTFA